MSLKLQKRIASYLLNVSKNKIKFNDKNLQEIGDAITKSDVRKLIGKKIITVKKTNAQSRYRARLNLLRKRKGRKQGIGSRKGSKNARLPSKKAWINKIRMQRSLLNILRSKGLLTKEIYRDLYNKSKGGFFRNQRHLKVYLEEHKILKNDENK